MITTSQSDTAKIRRTLNMAFDDSALSAFCFDYFPNVYNCFSQGFRKGEKITLLLDYCRRQPTGFETLLAPVDKEYKTSHFPREELKPLIDALEVYMDSSPRIAGTTKDGLGSQSAHSLPLTDTQPKVEVVMVVVGLVVVGLLLGLLEPNLFGGTGASGEPQVVKKTVVVEPEPEPEVEVTPTVTVENTLEPSSPTPEGPSPTPEGPSPTPEGPSPTPEGPSPTPEGPSPTPFVPSDTSVRSKDNMTMVFVPANSFQMGSEDGDGDEKPIDEVALDAFWIDQAEVSNAQFAAFLNQMGNQEEGSTTWLEADSEYVLIEQQNGTFQPKDGFAQHPAIMLSWYGAEAYCAWAGGRLPTEAEWEYAARGREALIYPWGNEFDGSRANCYSLDCSDGYDRTAPVETFPAGASWVGAYDMAGNVWEWVKDWYDADYYVRSLRDSPPGVLFEKAEDYPTKVLRGGSSNNDAGELRGANRNFEAPVYSSFNVGFRCILELGS